MIDFSAWAPTAITVVTVVFAAGKGSGRLKNVESNSEKHELRLNGHDEQLRDHEVEIERAKAWREGYNAGKSVKI